MTRPWPDPEACAVIADGGLVGGCVVVVREGRERRRWGSGVCVRLRVCELMYKMSMHACVCVCTLQDCGGNCQTCVDVFFFFWLRPLQPDARTHLTTQR